MSAASAPPRITSVHAVTSERSRRTDQAIDDYRNAREQVGSAPQLVSEHLDQLDQQLEWLTTIRQEILGDAGVTISAAVLRYRVIISDLLVDREPLFRGLEMLRHGRHDVLLFHILDADELSFPFQGTTRFEGMEELDHLLCDPRALRDGYMEALHEYLVEVRRGCSRRGIDYMLIPTSEYLDAALSKFLHHREAMFKTPAKI